MRFKYSYAETMQVPHNAALAMRGCRPRAKPHRPSSLHSCAATVLNVGMTCPGVRSATCHGSSVVRAWEERERKEGRGWN